VKYILDNNPISLNANELFEPDKPCCFPAIERSWQGKPADTTKPSLQDVEAKMVGLAKADGFPSDSFGGNCEPADSTKYIKMFHIDFSKNRYAQLTSY
jgi:hypothetical protein